jgi:hypothetical protein
MLPRTHAGSQSTAPTVSTVHQAGARLPAPELAHARRALELLLKHHEPYPALVLDPVCNIVMANAGMAILAKLFPVAVDSSAQPNLIRLMLHPGGMRQYLQDWEQLARRTLEHLRCERTNHPTNPELADLEAELSASSAVCHSGPVLAEPLDIVELRNEDVSVRLFSMLTTFWPAIPINFVNTDEFWEFMRLRPAAEAAVAFLLLLRTVARYPNHPMAQRFFDFVTGSLLEMADGRTGRLDQQVLQGLHVVPLHRMEEHLLRILANPQLETSLRAAAARGLANCELTSTGATTVAQQLERSMTMGRESANLVEELAIALVIHRPAIAPSLFQELVSLEATLGLTPRAVLLKHCRRLGYLVFDDHVVDPNGNKQPAVSFRELAKSERSQI